MFTCRVFSYVVEEGVCYDQFSWQNSVSLYPVSFCTPKPNLPVTQVSLDFLLLHSSPLWWKGHLFLVSVLEVLVGLHRTIHLLWHLWLGHRLGLLWCWIVCLENELRSFCHFSDCTQVLHFGFFCWRNSISSKGFLPIVIDIIVIWIEFAHSCPF